MKHTFLIFLLVNTCLGSFAQDRRMADREINHFSELAEQTKEYKETDSLLAVYNHTRHDNAEMRSMKFTVHIKNSNDDEQYLYGTIQWRESKHEVNVYYLKYDKSKRKIVSISKQPLN